MTNLELITAPIKRIAMKLQLIGGAGENFGGYQKTVFWDECEDNEWSYYEDDTWKEMGERSQDEAFNVISEIQGDAIFMSFSVDSTSDIRRVMSATMHMQSKEYFTSSFTTIWLNRLIRFQIGVYDWEAKDYTWFTLGSFMVTQSDYTFDAQTQNLTLNLADLMASVTEERGSQIGTEVVVPAESSMQQALQSTVERFFPFTFTNITDFDEETVPYDLEFERGIYPYEIARKIVTLYPTYEHFYTPDGTYTAQEVPTGIDDPVVLTADEMKALVISDSGSTSPGSIKNVTEVWGRQLEAERTASSCDGQTTPGVYKLFIDAAFETLEEGMTVSFTADVTSSIGQKMQIQDTAELSIVVYDGQNIARPLRRGEIRQDVQYMVKYTNGVFALQGESEIHALCLLYNETPSEDDLDDMKSKYNCYNVKVMIDRDSQFSIETIGEMIFVPWLDVNQKVSYQSIVTGETNDYLVQSIKANLEDFTMSVVMIRFYPFYPWLRKVAYWQDYKDTTWGELEDKYWDEVIYYENT